MKKKLSLILILAMMMSCIPAFAFADDSAQEATPTTTETGSETGDQIGSQTGDAASAESQNQKAPAQVYKNVAKKINGKYIYFNTSGKKDMSKGWKKTFEGYRYYSNGRVLVTKPTRIKGTKKVKYYWNKKKKTWQRTKIKNARTKYKKVATNYLYMFGTDGKLIVKKKGLFNDRGNRYYSLGRGVLKTGWAAVGNYAMYFNKKTGRMAKNTKVGYIKIPASGKLGRAYALGVRKLDSTKWTLWQAYKNSYKLKYKGRWYRAKDAETYAIRGFTKGYGNCYVMASTFYIQAKLLGYDVHQVQGKVAHIWSHSWTVIRENGKENVYDPNFRNETGRSGWKIWYGKRGTWRYTNKKKMN